MPTRIHLSITFLLVLVLSGSALGWEPIDNVNYNLSFELDTNFDQIRCKIEYLDDVYAWNDNEVDWATIEIDCADSLGTEDCICKDDGTTDGITRLTMGQWDMPTDNNLIVWQTLDPVYDANVIIKADHEYRMYFDTFRWMAPDFRAYFYYGYIDDNNSLDADVNVITELRFPEDVEADTWWIEEPYMLEFRAESGQPCIGEPLGIRFCEIGTGWYWIDNIRLEYRSLVIAYDPDPPHGGKDVPRDVTLSWNPGKYVSSTNGHEVYFGTSWEDVNSADRFDTTGIYKDNVVDGPDGDGRYSFSPVDEIPLVLGGTYYWRVDEVNEVYTPAPGQPEAPPDGRWKGEIWKFRVTGYAINPSPADGETDVQIDKVLSWTAGTESLQHEVYFGNSWEDVNDATKSDPEYKATRSTPSYDATSEMEFGKTYYWRIDEVGAGTLLKGDVWTFTVAEYYVIEDFDGYRKTNNLTEVWNDGGYNGTWSEAILENLTVRDGNSLSFKYNNYYWPYYSEVDATTAALGVTSNWRFGGAKSLALWFHGELGNDANQQMYVVLEDSDTDEAEVHYYGDMNDIRLAEWQEWNIDLDEFTDENSALDLMNIAKIYIGFGDREDGVSSGNNIDYYVYFEDVRLYPLRCVPKLAYKTGSFDGDCVTDYFDLAMLGDDWLLSGRDVLPDAPSDSPLIRYEMEDGTGTTVTNTGSATYNGTFGPDPFDPAWTVGYVGGGLRFDNDSEGAEGDFVSCNNPLNIVTNTLSITGWVKRDAEQVIYAPVVFWRSEGATVGFGLGSTADPDWWVNNELCYHWADAENSWSWHNGLILPAEVWTFIALTVAPDVASLYMGNGTDVQAVRNFAEHPLQDFHDLMYLGWDRIDIDANNPTNNRHFSGTMDDIRIYNRTLSDAEVLGVAGLSGSHHLPLESWRTDADDDDDVDMEDYAILADYWLEEVWFPIP